jgi:CHAD domain-containing protein
MSRATCGRWERGMAKAQEITSLEAHADVRSALPDIFGVRLSELWGFAEHMPYPDRVRELHDMRIAAKRLRYCFEFFSPCFSQIEGALKRFKKLQDYLGELHDCDVWVDYLRQQLRDAFAEMSAKRKALARFVGADPELQREAAQLEELLAHGPAQGLLMMLGDIVERRGKLYGELLTYWDELEQAQFRAELTHAVADAARGEDSKE